MKLSTISPKTRISELIKADPRVIDNLVELNPNFSKLRNPILRNILARRVNISDACAIAGCQVSDFLDKMVSIGFIADGQSDPAVPKDDDNISERTNIDRLKVVILDVRPVLASGSDPLQIILETSQALEDGECLKIINTFEPVPLISLLGKKGFRCWSERPEKNLVYTWFVKDESQQAASSIPAAEPLVSNSGLEFDERMALFGPERIRIIDVTALEMPQPMIQILENLSVLGLDEALFVYHKKVPVYLLPEMEERGFTYLIKQCADGKVHMLIFKI